MQQIIVTRGFNNADVIGSLQLADGIEVASDEVLAFGGVVKPEGFELLEISLIKDSNYQTTSDASFATALKNCGAFFKYLYRKEDGSFEAAGCYPTTTAVSGTGATPTDALNALLALM
jgi:hypothetical protein